MVVRMFQSHTKCKTPETPIIMYRLQQRRTLSLQDYHDFLQWAKWKFYKTDSGLKKVGNYLSVIGNDA